MNHLVMTVQIFNAVFLGLDTGLPWEIKVRCFPEFHRNHLTVEAASTALHLPMAKPPQTKTYRKWGRADLCLMCYDVVVMYYDVDPSATPPTPGTS